MADAPYTKIARSLLALSTEALEEAAEPLTADRRAHFVGRIESLEPAPARHRVGYTSRESQLAYAVARSLFHLARCLLVDGARPMSDEQRDDYRAEIRRLGAALGSCK